MSLLDAIGAAQNCTDAALFEKVGPLAMLAVPGGYNYTVGTKHGFFRPDLLWPIAMGGMYVFSLLILLYVIQQRLQVRPTPALLFALLHIRRCHVTVL